MNNCENTFSEKDIVTLDILSKKAGIYCKKSDNKGNDHLFAFITSDAMNLVIYDASGSSNIEIYDWHSNESISHEKIVTFLSELAFRPLFQNGTDAERIEAKGMWQYYDRLRVPSEFVEYINKNIKQ